MMTMLITTVAGKYRIGARAVIPTSTIGAVAATRATLYTTHFSCCRSTGPECRQRTRSATNPAARETWKTTFTGVTRGSIHSGKPTNPSCVGYLPKYSRKPELHSEPNCTHHRRDGGEPEGKRTTAVLNAATETTQAFTSHCTRPLASAASGRPRARVFTPAATPATISHQPTGFAGWRRVIGYPAAENPSAHRPDPPGRPHTTLLKSPPAKRSTVPTTASAIVTLNRAKPAMGATPPSPVVRRVRSPLPVILAFHRPPTR